MTSTTPTDALVLFAGCGGSSDGIETAGIPTTGVEYWPPAVRTHEANVGPCLLHDLSNPYDDHILDPWHGCKILWGSPPCQPFSGGGDGDGENDHRDGLPWFNRIVARLLPQVVFMENVRGLTFAKHSGPLSRCIDQLRQLGYLVDWRVLNFADYGIPQTRERLIVVARRDGGAPTWPTVTHTETEGMFTARWVSMAEALGWGMTARPAMTVAGGSEGHGGAGDPVGGSGARRRIHAEQTEGRWQLRPFYSEHPGHPDRDADAQPAPTVMLNSTDWHWRLHPGGFGGVNRRDYTPDEPAPTLALGNDVASWQWRLNTHVGAEQDGTTQTRDLDQPAPTVATASESQWYLERPVAADQRVFHPGGHTAYDGRDNTRTKGRSEDTIRVTIRELATLQGFRPDFEFHGSKAAQARQIGNAVPPAIARLLVEANMPKERQ